MNAVDQHAEAHRLKAEHGYGARRIAEQFGITRHAATLLLSHPPTAAAVVAEPVAEVAEPVAAAPEDDSQERQPLAEPVAEVAASQAQPLPVVAATDGHERRPAAVLRLPRRIPVDSRLTLDMDLSTQPVLRRALADLAVTGLTAEELVGQGLVVLALAYRQGVAAQRISPQGRFTVLGARAVPSQPGVAVPRRPAPDGGV